jgi:anti-sigma B factor antagonist
MRRNQRRKDSFEAKVQRGHEARVVVRGEIDITTADQLDRSLTEAAERGQPVVVDLRDTTFIDSTGLSALIRLATSLSEPPDPSLILLDDPCPAVHKTLMVSGMDRIMTIRHSGDVPN